MRTVGIDVFRAAHRDAGQITHIVHGERFVVREAGGIQPDDLLALRAAADHLALGGVQAVGIGEDHAAIALHLGDLQLAEVNAVEGRAAAAERVVQRVFVVDEFREGIVRTQRIHHQHVGGGAIGLFEQVTLGQFAQGADFLQQEGIVPPAGFAVDRPGVGVLMSGRTK